MAQILAIETATLNCSVALWQNGKVLSQREESSDRYIHSEKLHLFLDAVLQEASCTLADLDAIAVSGGPGSYTGLRIGVAAAKGLAYASSLPLIAVDTTAVLAAAWRRLYPSLAGQVIPMIDARRKEVFTATYHAQGSQISPIEALVVEAEAFDQLSGPLHFVGDGAPKCASILAGSERYFYPEIHYPQALDLASLAAEAFERQEFQDLAYYEPFYGKAFQAGAPKKLL